MKSLSDPIILVSKNSKLQRNENKKPSPTWLPTQKNGYNKKVKWYKTVAKMWGNSNSPTQLVGGQISATTLGNCLALSSTVEHICTLWPSITTSGHISNIMYTWVHKNV